MKIKLKLLCVITCIISSCGKNHEAPKYKVTVEAYLDSVKINANIAFLPETQAAFNNTKLDLSSYFTDGYNPSNGYNVSSRTVELQAGTYDISIQIVKGTSKLAAGTYAVKRIALNDTTKNLTYKMLFDSNLSGDRQPWKDLEPLD